MGIREWGAGTGGMEEVGIREWRAGSEEMGSWDTGNGEMEQLSLPITSPSFPMTPAARTLL